MQVEDRGMVWSVYITVKRISVVCHALMQWHGMFLTLLVGVGRTLKCFKAIPAEQFWGLKVFFSM